MYDTPFFIHKIHLVSILLPAVSTYLLFEEYHEINLSDNVQLLHLRLKTNCILLVPVYISDCNLYELKENA